MLASTMSRCFERVSCIKVKSNKFFTRPKITTISNNLSQGFLKNFARVSFRFLDVENLQYKRKTFLYIATRAESLPSRPSSTNQAIYIYLDSKTTSQHDQERQMATQISHKARQSKDAQYF